MNSDREDKNSKKRDIIKTIIIVFQFVLGIFALWIACSKIVPISEQINASRKAQMRGVIISVKPVKSTYGRYRVKSVISDIYKPNVARILIKDTKGNIYFHRAKWNAGAEIKQTRTIFGLGGKYPTEYGNSVILVAMDEKINTIVTNYFHFYENNNLRFNKADKSILTNDGCIILDELYFSPWSKTN